MSSLSPVTDGPNRRTSSRVTRKPPRLNAQSPASATSAKRKRTRGGASDNEEPEIASDEEESTEEDESEGEPDEEEIRERRRKQRQAAKGRPPAAKKQRAVNGTAKTVELAMRPAKGAARGRGAAKPKAKKARIAAPDDGAEEASGLYAEVFSKGQSIDAVTNDWVSLFESDEPEAVAQIVNFVLRCSGCSISIDANDCHDADNAQERLTEIAEEYQAQDVTTYPLITRSRSAASFRNTLTNFFDTLIKTIAARDKLFEENGILEQLASWIGMMSAAHIRPFRHTACLACLAIISALAEQGKEIMTDRAKKVRQHESEAKKARPNKARVAALKKEVDATAKKKEELDPLVTDWVTVVFTNRYKDVDPRIRQDCIQHLTDWITIYPELFFDGQYTKYLGWMLSDQAKDNRHEVVEGLKRLFGDKDKATGLRVFTERFKARMVEMATRDADATVRASTVQLLDLVRNTGLLEPEDLDLVGKLIYDSEPRVRRAVTKFFAANIEDLYESKLEELGGAETVTEALGLDEDDENYDTPRLEWLKLKCLVEQLQSYDEQEEDLPSQIERGPGGAYYTVVAAGLESRYSLAAQALYGAIPEVKEWEIMAGYLLYDHSRAQANGVSDDPEAQLKEACRLLDKEEIILLEIMNAAVKISLTESAETFNDKRQKRTKREKELLMEEQETAARRLATLIPRLLNKFGAVPEPATAVLRLEHVLNLDVLQELRRDSETYSALLDDINKQFLSHNNRSVLTEASAALLHAKTYDDLQEITEAKVQALWDDTTNTLRSMAKNSDLKERGSLGEEALTNAAHTMLRIANLAQISDCTEYFDDTNGIMTILFDCTSRGIFPARWRKHPDIDDPEDSISINAARAIMFYFMWRVRSIQNNLKSKLPFTDLDVLAQRRQAFVTTLTTIIQSRSGADEARLIITGILLDLHVLFTTLRNATPPDATSQSSQQTTLTSLIRPVPAPIQSLLPPILSQTEKAYAKKARITLEPDESDDPIELDDEPLASDDEAPSEEEEDELTQTGEPSQRRVERQKEILAAEQTLCELASKLVLGIIAGVVDQDFKSSSSSGEAARSKGKKGEEEIMGPVRRRLERNKTRLGHNFKEVVAHLDNPAKGAGKKVGKAKGKTAQKSKQAAKSVEVIESDEEDVDMLDEDGEEGLRARELVVEENGDEHVEEPEEPAGMDEVESVLGD